MIPVKMHWLLRPSFHISLCTVASWDIKCYLRDVKELPHQGPVVSLNHPWASPPNLYNIPLGEQQFLRTLLHGVGCTTLPQSLAVP